MIYKANSKDLREMIDRYKFGRYGDEEYPPRVYCSHCGATIVRNEEYYDVNNTNFCMDCESEAEELILELYRDRFIFTL